jgi:hypothetical protein
MLVSTILTNGSLRTGPTSWAATMVSENRVASMGIVTVVIGHTVRASSVLTCQQTT